MTVPLLIGCLGGTNIAESVAGGNELSANSRQQRVPNERGDERSSPRISGFQEVTMLISDPRRKRAGTLRDSSKFARSGQEPLARQLLASGKRYDQPPAEG